MRIIHRISSLFRKFRFSPACSEGPRPAIKNENGIWEAPGFYGTFICMVCGGKTGCNNIAACGCIQTVSKEPFKTKRCDSNRWAIGSIHVNDEFVLYHKPPNPDCIMARGMTIAVPDKDTLVLYQRNEESNGNPKIVGSISIRKMIWENKCQHLNQNLGTT